MIFCKTSVTCKIKKHLAHHRIRQVLFCIKRSRVYRVQAGIFCFYPIRPIKKIAKIIMGSTIINSHRIHPATFMPLPVLASAW